MWSFTARAGEPPGTAYGLQRAVDATPDDECTDALSAWLTSGAGLTPLAIVTDDN